MLPKEDDRAESVGERDDEWLFFTPPEVLGPVGGGASESNVFIMACSSADLSQESIVQYEVARDQVYAGLKAYIFGCQQKIKRSCSRKIFTEMENNSCVWYVGALSSAFNSTPPLFRVL